MKTKSAFKALLALLALNAAVVTAQECDKTFVGEINNGVFGGLFEETGLFKAGLDLSGMKDKLPPPSIGITLLIPNNHAWVNALWENSFFLPSIGDIGAQLPATMLYNVIPTPISPDQIAAGNGTVPTAYGLLGGGSDYNLQYYSDPVNEDGSPGKMRWYSAIRDDNAKVSQAIPVCNSWIYVVDDVLYPASGKIKDVEPIDIPDTLPWDNQQPAASGTTTPVVVEETNTTTTAVVVEEPPVEQQPSIPVCEIKPAGTINNTIQSHSIMVDTIPGAAYTITPDACNVTLADAARANGLNILSTLLSQKSIQPLLPSPGSPNTLYAPTDAAFFSMMAMYNISLTTAAESLGDILGSILLYHITPGYALTLEEIATRAGLTTDLGTRLNDNSYFIGVEDAATEGGNPVLLGLMSGNKANIVDQVQVCESQVYVIDNVLVPGPSLDAIPKTPVAAPAPVTPAPVPVVEPTPVVDDTNTTTTTTPSLNITPSTGSNSTNTGAVGSASNIGALANCLVKLQLPGGELTAITDALGQFNFPDLVGCALQQAMAWLPAGDEQLASCMDIATEKPPPFTLTALLDVLADGGNTDSLLFTLSPVVSLLTRELGSGDANLLSAPWVGDLASLLGLSSPSSLFSGDYYDKAGNGDMDALSVLASNAYTLITTTLGGEAISNMVPDINLEDAASSLLGALGSAAKGNASIIDPSEIENILSSTLGGFLGGSSNSNPLGGITDLISGSGDGALGGIEDILGGDSLGDLVAPLTDVLSGGNGGMRKFLQLPIEATTSAPAPVVAETTEEGGTSTSWEEQVLKAVAQPIAFLNGISQQAIMAARKNPETLSASATSTVQRIAAVANDELKPAVADLAAKKITIEEFNTMFSPPNLTMMVYPMANEDSADAPASTTIVAGNNIDALESNTAPVTSGSNKAVIGSLAAVFAILAL